MENKILFINASVRENSRTAELSRHLLDSLDGKIEEVIVKGGYLDLGINDTMQDLIVNFIGAVVFSVLGLLYISNRDKYKFAENFIPIKRFEKE